MAARPNRKFISETLILCVIATCAAISAPSGMARKVNLRFKSDSKEMRAEARQERTAKGSFLVASQCPDCNNGYTLDQISFSGFDKPARSSSESFFITNHTDRTMSGLSLYIEYLTPDGRQLHKQFLKLDCDIPAGETRKADIKSWDTQHSFHYHLSPAGKSSSPFTVRIDPVSYRLRF